MARKTFDVEALRQSVNTRLQLSTCSPEERMAMFSILEEVLIATGNYKGFNFTDSNDESRRRYY